MFVREYFSELSDMFLYVSTAAVAGQSDLVTSVANQNGPRVDILLSV